MYGDVRKAGEVNLKVLEFGIPIPYETINDPVIMKTIRTMARFNPDMPGAIELVHPNKFLPSNSRNIIIFFIDLRPVEEFRHTPIIPISEKDLADHKHKVEEANRKGYYVEIKKDTIYFYSMLNQYFHFSFPILILFPYLFVIVIASMALGMIVYAFMMMNEKQMQIKKDLDRTKMLRYRANAGKKGGNIEHERRLENVEQGRALF